MEKNKNKWDVEYRVMKIGRVELRWWLGSATFVGFGFFWFWIFLSRSVLIGSHVFLSKSFIFAQLYIVFSFVLSDFAFFVLF